MRDAGDLDPPAPHCRRHLKVITSGDEIAQPHTDLATGIETKICGRCHGSGKHSYNFMQKDMCYGCQGTGTVRTRRGDAARNFFTASLLSRAKDVCVGWVARGDSGKWHPVRQIEDYTLRGSSLKDAVMVPYELLGVVIFYANCGHVMQVSDTIAAQPNMEAVKELKATALAYQQTLTQAGTVRKKAA